MWLLTYLCTKLEQIYWPKLCRLHIYVLGLNRVADLYGKFWLGILTSIGKSSWDRLWPSQRHPILWRFPDLAAHPTRWVSRFDYRWSSLQSQKSGLGLFCISGGLHSLVNPMDNTSSSHSKAYRLSLHYGFFRSAGRSQSTSQSAFLGMPLVNLAL